MPQLSFAQNRQNYVGMPLDVADNTMSVLQEKYIANKDAADKLEIMANNLELLDSDTHHKDRILSEVAGVLDDVTKTGDWENATLHVKNAAKTVAADQGLNQAIRSKSQRDQQVAALKEKVGKPFEEGGITMEDFQREVAKGDATYTGVKRDPNTNAWVGHWKANTPPAYLDRGAYIDEFLDGWQANKLLGDLAKGEDGKWYRVKYDTTPGGEYYITEYNEEASDKDVYAAARKHLMQNKNIRERVAYEVANTKGTYDDFAAQGINRLAMIKQLKALGVPTVDLDTMSNDELAQTFKTEMVVFDSIKGAVDKHSFKRETVQVLGKTWEQIMRETRLKNAKRDGGDNDTVMQDRVIAQYLTEGYNLNEIPKSIEDYQKAIDSWDTQILKHQKAIDQIKGQLVDNPNDPTLQAELASAQTKLKEYERNAEEYDYWYEKAVKKTLSGQSGVDMNEINNYFRNKKDLARLSNSSDVQRVEKALGTKSKTFVSGTAMIAGGTKSPWERTGELDSLVKSGKISRQEADAYRKYAGLKKSEDTFFGKMKSQGQDIIKSINGEMQRQAAEKTTAFGYVDLSVDDFGKETAFTSRATQLLKNNYQNYRVIDTDGEAVAFSNLDEEDKYNPDRTKIIGVTTQYVGNHGYLLYAREDVVDEDGNMTGSRFHLIKPTSMDGMLDSAIQEARKGTKVTNNQIKAGYNLQNPNELEQIWRYTDVDRQMAEFDNHPIITPLDRGSDKPYEEVTKPVNIGIRYNGEVTRQVNNAGDVKWKVQVRDRNTGEIATKTYTSLYAAEHALEYLAGSGYAVPLSTLQRMSDYSFVNGTIDRNQVSTPYLAPDFYNELKKLDDDMGLPFTITSMTRSQEANKESNGIDTSRHKFGRGVDMKAEPQVVAWLNRNSTEIPNSNYKKIMGTDLMYLVHDAGTGDHIHIEHTTQPDGVRAVSDIDYMFGNR